MDQNFTSGVYQDGEYNGGRKRSSSWEVLTMQGLPRKETEIFVHTYCFFMINNYVSSNTSTATCTPHYLKLHDITEQIYYNIFILHG